MFGVLDSSTDCQKLGIAIHVVMSETGNLRIWDMISKDPKFEYRLGDS